MERLTKIGRKCYSYLKEIISPNFRLTRKKAVIQCKMSKRSELIVHRKTNKNDL